MRSDLETRLPGLAAFIADQWRMHEHDASWMDLRAWLSGIGAALYFVCDDAFGEAISELELLEQVCTYRHRRRFQADCGCARYALQ